MKRKNEENLIKLAFGDLEPGEAERAKKLLADDAEASRMLAGYSEIREGLKQLNAHTPSHQLSTERLREAILRDGLKKEKPAATGWRWTFAPFAVAAAAMLITIRFMGQSGVNLPIIKGGGIPEIKNDAGLIRNPIERSFGTDPLEVRHSEMGNEQERPHTRASSSVSNREIAPSIPAMSPASVVSSSKTDKVLNLAAEKKEAAGGAVTAADYSNLAIEGALPAGAVALNLDSNGEQPIVLIGSDSDESTGANRATEVSSTSNVVIGG